MSKSRSQKFSAILGILYFGLFASNLAHASIASDLPCQIHVKYFYTTGAKQEKTYFVKADSEKDCREKSKLYEPNSTPRKIRKKEVSIVWKSE